MIDRAAVGVQSYDDGIWAIGAGAGPLDARVFVRGVPSYAVGVTGQPQRILAAGTPLGSVIIQNLGLSPFELGTGPGLGYGQGIAVPARSQWSAAGVSPIWSSPQYYDRNPVSFVQVYDAVHAGIVAAGAVSVVWSYINTGATRAFIEAMQCITEIATVYAAAGYLESGIAIQAPAGGAVTTVVRARIGIANAVGSRAEAVLGSSMELQPGEAAYGYTVDPRAGGSCMHVVSAKITQFDR